MFFFGRTSPLIKLVNIAGNVHSSSQGFTDLYHFENNKAYTVNTSEAKSVSGFAKLCMINDNKCM